MTDDARLTDFVDGAADGGESDAAEQVPAAGESDQADDTDAAGESGQVDDADRAEPPEEPSVTAKWTPEGAACEACGETVGRRWLDGDARVCADCKEW